jgi:hypothetical protein
VGFPITAVPHELTPEFKTYEVRAIEFKNKV